MCPGGPLQLIQILSNDSISDIISWLPSKKEFMIHDKKRFARETLSAYFEHNSFKEFTRQMKKWKFRLSKSSYHPSKKAYSHALFQKDNEAALRRMCAKPNRMPLAGMRSSRKAHIPIPSCVTANINPRLDSEVDILVTWNTTNADEAQPPVDVSRLSHSSNAVHTFPDAQQSFSLPNTFIEEGRCHEDTPISSAENEMHVHLFDNNPCYRQYYLSSLIHIYAAHQAELTRVIVHSREAIPESTSSSADMVDDSIGLQ